MSLTYIETDHSTQGKTSEHTDVVKGRFLEFAPDERIVQLVEFQSDDRKEDHDVGLRSSLENLADYIE
ncbi:MAG: ATPase [Paenibacillus sp.]|nr:ATPase [Paenibacillus sp.]